MGYRGNHGMLHRPVALQHAHKPAEGFGVERVEVVKCQQPRILDSAQHPHQQVHNEDEFPIGRRPHGAEDLPVSPAEEDGQALFLHAESQGESRKNLLSRLVGLAFQRCKDALDDQGAEPAFRVERLDDAVKRSSPGADLR